LGFAELAPELLQAQNWGLHGGPARGAYANSPA
jgi:hypothetical protein